MGTVVIVVIVIVLLAVAGGAALVLARRKREQKQQQELAEQFGPEYERRVAETGDRKAVEAELKARKEHHDQLQLRPLVPGERDRFRGDWLEIQRGFVDDPAGSVEHADALVVTIMRQRGYPVEDGRQRADDLSVAHPHVVEHYRVARRIASANRDGQAGTEDLRTAVTSFRSLVEALLEDVDGQDGPDGGPGPDGGRPSEGRHGGGRPPADPAGPDPAGPQAGTQRLDRPGAGTPPPGGPEASTQQLGADRGGNEDGTRR